MRAFAYTAGERMKDKCFIKNLSEGGIKHLVYQPVSDASFAYITLLGIKHMEVLISPMLIT